MKMKFITFDFHINKKLLGMDQQQFISSRKQIALGIFFPKYVHLTLVSERD